VGSSLHPWALAGLRWRRRRVLELKLAGFSYREIMEILGVTTPTSTGT
jgi:DNA-directed RNA polymerase specialized sigma24 family protein